MIPLNLYYIERVVEHKKGHYAKTHNFKYVFIIDGEIGGGGERMRKKWTWNIKPIQAGFSTSRIDL